MAEEVFEVTPRPALDWKRAWGEIIVLVLILRAAYAAIAWVALKYGIALSPVAGGSLEMVSSMLKSDPFSTYFINPWVRWDSVHYLDIALQGFTDRDGLTAFAPLYPALVALFSWLAGDVALAGLLVSTLAAALAGILLYETALDAGLDATGSNATVLNFLLFPSAFFLQAIYTESVFLCLALGTWLLARRGHWGLAALTGALAALARFQGAVLAPVLAILWLSRTTGDALPPAQAWRSILKLIVSPRRWRDLPLPGLGVATAVMAPAVSLGAYLLVLSLLGLDAPNESLLRFWGIRSVMPWEGFLLYAAQLLGGRSWLFSDWLDLGLLLVVAGVTLAGWRHIHPALLVYSTAGLAFLFMRGHDFWLLMSYNRYLLAVFPFFLQAASLRLPPAVRATTWLVGFALQAWMLYAFILWRWVG